MSSALWRVLAGTLVFVWPLFMNSVQAEPAKVHGGSGQVFVLSGLMGEFLSPGLEGLAAKIRGRGIAVTVSSHSTYSSRAADAAAAWNAGNRGAIVIIGHSLGASAAVAMAQQLKEKNIPVRLIVSLAPTSDLEIPSNVSSVVNYYQSTGASRGKANRGSGSRVSISNIDLGNSPDVNHFNMVQRDRVHRETMSRVFSLVSASRKRSTPVQAVAVTASPGQHGAN